MKLRMCCLTLFKRLTSQTEKKLACTIICEVIKILPNMCDFSVYFFNNEKIEEELRQVTR